MPIRSSVGPNEISSVNSVLRGWSSAFAFSTTFFSVEQAPTASSVLANAGTTVSNRG